MPVSAYIYMHTTQFVMVAKDEVSFIIDGRLYSIRREGDTYFLLIEDGNKYRIKDYSIDCDDVIIISDKELPLDWGFEVVDDEV